MDLSIIIVNWNTRDLLAQCLTSIFANPPEAEYEVLVVDNASTDGSSQRVREGFAQVKLICNLQNKGFSQANNQAILASRGHYVLLLNPDTEVKAGALRALIDFMDQHPEAGAAGPCLLNSDRSLQVSCHPFPTLFREFWFLFHLDLIYPLTKYPVESWGRELPHEVDAVKGACMILRRRALDQVGLLDVAYYMYSEEVDLCYRLKRGHWRIYWVPQAEVVHYGGQSTQQMAREMFLQLYQSKLRYIRKHFGSLRGWVYKFILIAAAFPRLGLVPLAWLGEQSKRQPRLTLAGHYWQLLRQMPRM